MGVLTSSKPSSFVDPHLFVVADVKSSAKDVVELSADDQITGKDFITGPFDLQTYASENVWLTIFQINKVQKPLRAVFQKP